MQHKLLQIKANRQDITDWVIHWTHRQYNGRKMQSPWGILKDVLKCGYLKPSKAPRPVNTLGRANYDTIRGDFPAVCFSEQPLSAFLASFFANGRRYPRCGIAFEKRHLFQYGGRPVIYGDKDMLDRLHKEDKYLWFNYDPLRQPPIDFTHEREWRTKVKICNFPGWGQTPEEGVPLVLPPIEISGESLISFPRILVINSELAEDVHEWLKAIQEYKGKNSYIKYLHAHYTELKIIPLDIVYDKLEDGDERWSRLDTIPIDDIPQ